MKYVALDLWEDLREKRLWPVAAALLLAVIAIPVFVIQPAEEPAPAAAPEAQQAPATPAVTVVDEAFGESSKLNVFGKKDPFRPPAAALKPSTSGASSSGGSVAGPSGTPPASTGPSAASGSAPLGSSGGGGSAPATPRAPAAPRAPATPRAGPVPGRAYTYVVDLDFGREGHTRVRRGISRVSVLPSERNPVAVFLGVPAGGTRAVFLLNAAFKQSGQGTCRPSRATCTFLHLSTNPAKNGHRIVDGKGVTYILRLRNIRRVTVREESRASRRSARARAGAKSGAVISSVFAGEQR